MIKFKDSEESKLFVTGCLHLNHDPKWNVPIWESRGYSSCEDMTNNIIDKINANCRESDVLFVVGDFCLNTSLEQFYSFVERINADLWFIEGNHPNPWLKAYKQYSVEKHGVVASDAYWTLPNGKSVRYLGHHVELTWNKKKFVLNHFPLLVFNNSSRGTMHLHAHCHGGLPTSQPDHLDAGKILEVSWDVFKKPVDFVNIMKIMDKKPIKRYDEHH